MNAFPSWLAYLAEAGRLAPSADNSQPWRFVFDGQRFTVEFDEARGGQLGRRHPAVLLAFGALLENLIQAAKAAEIDTGRWEFPDFLKTGCLVQIPTPTQSLIEVEVPKVICARHTNRSPFAKKHLAGDLVKAIQALGQGELKTLVFTKQEAITQLSELVRLASELRFQTEEIHRWLAGSLRFTEEEAARGDGLDIDTLALPPGGKLLSRFLRRWERMAALNRLGAYKLLAYIEASQFTQAGAIVAIVSKGRENSVWIEAGRLMERVWLAFTEQELAIHPYFVLADQLWRFETGKIPAHLHETAARLAQEAKALFAEMTPLMLLRVGYAKQAAKRSKRLPISVLVSAQG